MKFYCLLPTDAFRWPAWRPNALGSPGLKHSAISDFAFSALVALLRYSRSFCFLPPYSTLIAAVVFFFMMRRMYLNEIDRLKRERDELQEKLTQQTVQHSRFRGGQT